MFLGSHMMRFCSFLTATLFPFLIVTGKLTVLLQIGPHKTANHAKSTNEANKNYIQYRFHHVITETQSYFSSSVGKHKQCQILETKIKNAISSYSVKAYFGISVSFE
jgi:hypothetical protein